MKHDVLIYLTDEKLGVSYDVDENGKDLVLPLDSTIEVELVDRLLKDPNFWMQFLCAMSNALKRPATITEENPIDPEAK